MLIAGTFFGFGWSAPEEVHAAAGDTVEASSIAADDIIYYGNYPQTDLGKVGIAAVPGGTVDVDYVVQSTSNAYAGDDGDHYFKIEPIAWKVLENGSGKLFLLSEKAIDAKAYNKYYKSITWEKCTARSWLNGYDAGENTDGENYSAAGDNFIGNAFSAAEQGKIVNGTIENPANPDYTSVPTGPSTTDKIFYLTIDDVNNNANYGFTTDNSRLAQATGYAEAMGAYVYSGNAMWWLRSPGSTANYAADVTLNGGLATNGNYANTKSLVARPAFYLSNLSDLDLIETSAGDYLAVVPSENAYLKLSLGTALTPSYSPEITEYSVEVPYATSSVDFDAETYNESATVEGDGEQDFTVDEQEFEITVTAEDESTEKTYTVTVTRAAASTDATLSDLSVSAGELDPGFASGTTEYAVEVPYSTSSITLTAETTDENASVTGDGEQDLDVGANPFEITVTAEDGTAEKTYTVTVTRGEASANADLKSLSISGAVLAPAFNANTINYSANVPNAIAQVTIAAAAADANARVTGTGAKALNVGANKFDIKVTAENGSVKTYTVTVTRAAPIPVVKPVYPKVTSIKTPMTKMSIVVKKGKLNLKNLVGLYTTGNKPIKDSKLTWTSSKPKIATVSKTGAVKAGKKTGKTTITVKAQNGKKLKITISVVKKAKKLKKLTGKVPKLKKGKPAFITLKGTGTNITKIKWKVKGKGLKIDKFGMATATKKGKFTITATAGGKKFTKKITVK